MTSLSRPSWLHSLDHTEEALGPEHPDLAVTLMTYAAFLQESNREAEAEAARARANAILAKQSDKAMEAIEKATKAVQEKP